MTSRAFFVTITGFGHYYGRTPFTPGTVLRLVKEPQNEFDSDAIRAELPYIGKVGYVANSPDTTAGGTFSAGRIYDRFDRVCYALVMFTTFTKIICQVFSEDEGEDGLEALMRRQADSGIDIIRDLTQKDRTKEDGGANSVDFGKGLRDLIDN